MTSPRLSICWDKALAGTNTTSESRACPGSGSPQLKTLRSLRSAKASFTCTSSLRRHMPACVGQLVQWQDCVSALIQTLASCGWEWSRRGINISLHDQRYQRFQSCGCMSYQSYLQAAVATVAMQEQHFVLSASLAMGMQPSTCRMT